MLRWTMGIALVAAALTCGSAASARRSAIDQDPDGNATSVTLGGYCDLNGDDCGLPVALSYLGTPYTVSFNGGPAIDSFYVHGNGILSFGASIEFGDPFDPSSFASQILNDFVDPAITAYGLNLVSVGQHNESDPLSSSFPPGFFQSADYGIDSSGRIYAEFYTCITPQVCRTGVQRLTLTPTANGFLGEISGTQYGSDRGYVIDGAFTPTGNSFLMPATFAGLAVAGVPEPASWATMILGFGLAGSVARRRRAANRFVRA